MFLLRIGLFTVIFYLVLNFGRIRNGEMYWQGNSLFLPFSLALALTIVDSCLRIAFYYGFLLFILIVVISYLVLRCLSGDGRRKQLKD
jgi:hypothetical protein